MIRRQFRRLAGCLAVLTAAVLGLVATATPALAQAGEDGEVPVPDGIVVSAHWVTLATGLVLPLVTGLLLRPENPAWLKIGLAGAVTLVANLFLQAVLPDGTAVLSEAWFVQAVILFGESMLTYLGLWNPLFSRAGGVNAATPNVVSFPTRSHPPGERRAA